MYSAETNMILQGSLLGVQRRRDRESDLLFRFHFRLRQVTANMVLHLS